MRFNIRFPNKMIQKLINLVRQDQFYIPRDYNTIGGMWTVDTWMRDGVRVQLMDGGYTTVILADGLDVATGYNGKQYVTFSKGDMDVVEMYIEQLENR